MANVDQLEVPGELLERLDDEAAAALLAYRFDRLSEAGFSLFPALALATQTDHSLDSILAAFRTPVGAAA